MPAISCTPPSTLPVDRDARPVICEPGLVAPVSLLTELLYRRRPLSPPLSPPISPPLRPPFGPGSYPSSSSEGPIVPRLREGHRRRFSDGDKRRILDEAAQPGASAAGVARRYGIAQRVLRRWKQELTAAAPTFVTVQITDAITSQQEGHAP